MRHTANRLALCALLAALSAACATTTEQGKKTAQAEDQTERPTFLTPKMSDDASQQAKVSSSDSRRGEKKQKLSADEELAASQKVAAELRRIETQRRLGRTSELREEVMARLTKDPSDLFAKLYQAWIDFPSESTGTQINYLTKKNPDEPWLYTAMARLYLAWPNFADVAESEADKALALSPTFIPALAVKAETLRLHGKTDEALKLFREVLARDPECFEAYLGLSLAEETAGNLRAAHAALDSALAVDNTNPVLIRRLIEILLKEGDEKSAVPLYTRLIEMNPLDIELKLKRGRLLLSLGDKAAAAPDLEAHLAAAPTEEIAAELVGIYRTLSRSADEVRALEAWIRFDGGAKAVNYRRLYDLYRESGDTEGAEGYLVKAIGADATDMELRRLLASSQLERGDILKAIVTLRRAASEGDTKSAGERDRLEASIGLSKKPLIGNANRVYNSLFLSMQKALIARQKEVPGLMGGIQRVRVQIGEGGAIKAVEILQDTIGDANLKALLYFTLLDAQIPGGSPRAVTFEIDLTGTGS